MVPDLGIVSPCHFDGFGTLLPLYLSGLRCRKDIVVQLLGVYAGHV